MQILQATDALLATYRPNSSLHHRTACRYFLYRKADFLRQLAPTLIHSFSQTHPTNIDGDEGINSKPTHF